MPRKGPRITEHRQRLEKALGRGWKTADQLATAAKIAPRTARHHLRAMVKEGTVEFQATFPALTYRRAQ